MSGTRRVQSACPEAGPAGGSRSAADRPPRRTVWPDGPLASRCPPCRPVMPATLPAMVPAARRAIVFDTFRAMALDALRAMTLDALRAMALDALRAMTGRRRPILPSGHAHADLTPMLNSRPATGLLSGFTS
jgi:hypothetical protein